MTDLALPIATSPTLPFRSPARWLALFLVLAVLALPDCCLEGSHVFGAGMDTFGPICRARA